MIDVGRWDYRTYTASGILSHIALATRQSEVLHMRLPCAVPFYIHLVSGREQGRLGKVYPRVFVVACRRMRIGEPSHPHSLQGQLPVGEGRWNRAMF